MSAPKSLSRRLSHATNTVYVLIRMLSSTLDKLDSVLLSEVPLPQGPHLGLEPLTRISRLELTQRLYAPSLTLVTS